MPFIILRYNPSIPCFFRPFIMKGAWIFVKSFCWTYWGDLQFLPFIIFMFCITYIDFMYFLLICILKMNPTWSWCVIFLNTLLNPVWKYFIEIFCACSLGLCSLVYSFLFCCCIIIQGVTGFIEWVWKCPFTFYLMESFVEHCMSFSLKSSRIPQWIHWSSAFPCCIILY
jgi:hypothetical protein